MPVTYASALAGISSCLCSNLNSKGGVRRLCLLLKLLPAYADALKQMRCVSTLPVYVAGVLKFKLIISARVLRKHAQ